MGVLHGWRFCPRCAAPLTPGDGFRRCEACAHVYWANPVPGAQALVERDRRLLLGRRRHEPGRDRWDLPGGFVHEDEHPEDAVRREVREETGLELELGDFFGIWLQEYAGRTVLSLTWLARPAGGLEQPGDDLVELRWFAADELPGPDSLAFSSYVEILSLWRRHQHA